MVDWKKLLLHIILPNRCMFCGKPVEYNERLCNFCEEHKPSTDLRHCLICGKEVCSGHRQDRGIDWLAAPFSYELGADRAVQDMKFNDNRSNVDKLAYYMERALGDAGKSESFDLILPLPMYGADLRKRGYNQAEALAKQIAVRTGKPIQTELLQKVRKTESQHSLNAEERRKNLKDAFAVRNADTIAGKRILLVDDVYTTGATIAAGAMPLWQAGAASVAALVAAKTNSLADGTEVDAMSPPEIYEMLS